MRTLLAVLIALLALAPAPTAPHIFILQVVYITPPGETFTQAERDEVQQAAKLAATWWHELSPVPVAFTFTEPISASVDYDVYREWPRLIPNPAPSSDTIVFYVVDNSESWTLFRLGDRRVEGMAMWDPRIAWVVGSADVSVYAHELGHAAMGLFDRYTHDVDIMAYTANLAFRSRFIGCGSLGLLGKACQKIYLPLTSN